MLALYKDYYYPVSSTKIEESHSQQTSPIALGNPSSLETLFSDAKTVKSKSNKSSTVDLESAINSARESALPSSWSPTPVFCGIPQKYHTGRIEDTAPCNHICGRPGPNITGCQTAANRL